ncbi:unnamed protein product [Laminaria digitata]
MLGFCSSCIIARFVCIFATPVFAILRSAPNRAACVVCIYCCGDVVEPCMLPRKVDFVQLIVHPLSARECRSGAGIIRKKLVFFYTRVYHMIHGTSRSFCFSQG